MSLEITVQNALKAAMLAKDQGALRTLRALKSAIIIIKMEKGFEGEVSEEQELKLLQKLTKQRKDSRKIYLDQNRPDLADKETEEILVLEAFLPKQLSEEELTTILKEIVSDSGASSIRDMGQIIGIANVKVAGQAEGQIIAKIVKDLLQ
jgi:hypothetical protein